MVKVEIPDVCEISFVAEHLYLLQQESDGQKTNPRYGFSQMT